MWIKHIPYGEAKEALLRLYDRVKGPDNNVDNIMLAHSLRPHSMTGHMALYKSVLHHHANTIDKSFLETLGTHVSLLNGCEYCADHHFAGLTRLLGDMDRANAIWKALSTGDGEHIFDNKEQSAIDYASKLTKTPADMIEADMIALRIAGWGDGEILEINQVVAYFSYANRTVLGLGVNTHGDDIGLSPSDNSNSENWGHQ